MLSSDLCGFVKASDPGKRCAARARDVEKVLPTRNELRRGGSCKWRVRELCLSFAFAYIVSR
jgi:hypothetical protein